MSSTTTKIDRARGFLSRRDYSSQELRMRLKRLDYAEDEIETILETLRDEGSINEQRFAESRARHRASLGYGPGYVSQELRTHNIDAETIHQALETVDWTSAWLKRSRKMPKNSPEAEYHLAMRYGFKKEHISNAS
jgi:regulatory protein